MTEQIWKSFAEQSSTLSLEQDNGKPLELRMGDGLANVRPKSCAMLAALTLTLSVVSIGAAKAIAAEPPQNKKTADQAQAATRQPTAVELETWRTMILRTPRPKKGEGCFVATYPETEWREVTCKTPPKKLYPPKRPGMVRTDIVGGAGPDFSAVVTGHITEAEGSFDSVSGVTSECAVQCPNQVCPANPSCTAPTNQYSLQLNPKPSPTTTCSGSQPVSGETCAGWEQFVYTSSGGGFIQYWLEFYGPAGTACPLPHGAVCAPGTSESDGWCPFQFTATGPVYYVVNAMNSAPAPAEPATSLGQLKVRAARPASTAT